MACVILTSDYAVQADSIWQVDGLLRRIQDDHLLMDRMDKSWMQFGY